MTVCINVQPMLNLPAQIQSNFTCVQGWEQKSISGNRRGEWHWTITGLAAQSEWLVSSEQLSVLQKYEDNYVLFFFLPAEATRQSTERKPFCNLEWCKMSLLGCNNHGQSSSHNIINYVLIMGMWKMTSSLKVQFRSSAYKIKGRMLYVAEKVNHLSTSTSTHSS